MSKSIKKSTTQVAATAPAVVASSSKSAKKGKREAEDELQNEASAKKKIKIVQKKNIKKKEEISTSEDFSSDEEPAVHTKKQPAKVSKDGSVGVPTKKEKPVTSADSSDSDSEEETESKEVIPPRKPAVASRNGSVAVSKKKTESSESSGPDDSNSDEDKNSANVAFKINQTPVDVASTKNVSAVVPQRKDESSDSFDSGSSSDEDDTNSVKVASKIKQTPVAAAATTKHDPAVVTQKKYESSDSFDSDSSSDENDETAGRITSHTKKVMVSAPKSVLAVASKKVETSVSSSEGESEEDEKNVAKGPAGSMQTVPSKSAPGPTNEKQESSSESSSESDSDDEDIKKSAILAASKGVPSKKKEELSETSESDSNEDDVKGDRDEEMVDAGSPKTNNKAAVTNSEKKAPETPATPTPQVQNNGSKTLFVGNLSLYAHHKDIEEFFKDAGEIIEIRRPTYKNGRNFSRYGHVVFATEATAQKALKMNGLDLRGQAVKLGPAYETGSSTPHIGEESNSYLKGGRRKRKSISVRGFDTSVGINQTQSTLKEHFGSCGEISRVFVPKKDNTGFPKGYAHIDFTDDGGLAKALELDGSKLGDYSLTVEVGIPNWESERKRRQGQRG